MDKTWEKMPKIPVSWGEVFDKLTILDIKLKKIKDIEKLTNISNEKKQIENIVGDYKKFPTKLDSLIKELFDININLWDIEEKKREYEVKKDFDKNFIELSRQVYIQNDNRAKIKKEINILLQSEIIEEKSHKSY